VSQASVERIFREPVQVLVDLGLGMVGLESSGRLLLILLDGFSSFPPGWVNHTFLLLNECFTDGLLLLLGQVIMGHSLSPLGRGALPRTRELADDLLFEVFVLLHLDGFRSLGFLFGLP